MKRFSLVSAGVLLTGSLVACAGGAATDSMESAEGEAPVTTSEPVTITIMEYQQTRIDAVAEAIPGFEAAMKEQGLDITVELIGEPLTDDQFNTKITQQLIAGEAPDLIDMGDRFVVGLAGAGYLAPLDDYLADWDGWDHYFPQFKEALVRQDGKIYSLVHETGVQNLFYRKDLISDLGIDTTQPETWDDLIARMAQMKEQTGQSVIVIPAGTSWGGGTWGEGFLPILGGTDQSFYDLETGKWDLQSEGFRAVFDLYDELSTAGLLPNQDLLNPNPWEPTKYDKFPAGDLLVAAQGTWGWKFDWGADGASPIADVETNVDTWQYPALRAGDALHGWSGLGYSFVIPEASEHKDEAMLLAQYLSSGEALARQLVAVGAAPVRDDMGDVAPFADEPKLVQAALDVASSVYIPTGDGSEQVAQAVATATELILTGDASGAEAYDEFVSLATDLLGPDLLN